MVIPRIFALTDLENRINVQIENNIISIAREAGLETYWLFAQGFLKTCDQGASIIPLYAQKQILIPGKNDLDLVS